MAIDRTRQLLDWPDDVTELVDAVPNFSASFHPEEGHLNLPYDRIGEILTALGA